MKRIYKYLIIAVLLLGAGYVQAAEYYKAKISAEGKSLEALDAKISSQRAYNAQNSRRIETRAQIATILCNHGISLHHNPALLAELIMVKSDQHGLDPFLVLGIIQAESSFNSRAVSSKGAMGLMQLKPVTASYIAPGLDLADDDTRVLLDDNELNISLGTKYLAKLIRRFGSLELALEAYNRGPTMLHQQLTEGDDVERGYSGKVITHYQRFKAASRRL